MAMKTQHAAVLACVVLSVALFVIYSNSSARSRISAGLPSPRRHQDSLPSRGDPRPSTAAAPAWEREATAVRLCVAAKQSTLALADFWRSWSALVQQCSARFAGALRLQHMNNRDDVKLVTGADAAADCTVLTLGVGGDLAAERALLAANPRCRFFGADPIEFAGRPFEQIGRYFPVGVGAAAGLVEAHVIVGPKLWDYGRRNLSIVSIVDLMRTSVNLSRVDHLWLDAEGAEYELMPLFFDQGLLHTAGIVFCQLNVEFHRPFAEYRTSDAAFRDMASALVSRSDYLPVYASTVVAPHVRAYFINTRDPACVGKYLTPVDFPAAG